MERVVFLYYASLFVLFLGAIIALVVAGLITARRPRKADREYRASLRGAAASYDDEGVHGDVVIVPHARPFADSEAPR